MFQGNQSQFIVFSLTEIYLIDIIIIISCGILSPILRMKLFEFFLDITLFVINYFYHFIVLIPYIFMRNCLLFSLLFLNMIDFYNL